MKIKLIKRLFVGSVVVAGLGLSVQSNAEPIVSMFSSILSINEMIKVGKLKKTERITVTLADGMVISTATDRNLKMALPLLKAGGIDMSSTVSNTSGEPASIVWVFSNNGDFSQNKIDSMAYRVTPSTGLVATNTNYLFTNPLLLNMATSALVSCSDVVITTHPSELVLVYNGTNLGTFSANSIPKRISVGN